MASDINTSRNLRRWFNARKWPYTGYWAWRHPRDNGIELVELKGDVRFHDVVFGYNETHPDFKRY